MYFSYLYDEYYVFNTDSISLTTNFVFSDIGKHQDITIRTKLQESKIFHNFILFFLPVNATQVLHQEIFVSQEQPSTADLQQLIAVSEIDETSIR